MSARIQPQEGDEPPQREAGTGRATWMELREQLEAGGFRPSRRLGQNFLVDINAARAIARDAAVGSGDFVLEVGVGLGFLTAPLLARGIARLLAVEIDARLAEIARTALGDDPRVQWVLCDVLAGKHALSPAVEALLPGCGAWHVVSNLPYAISGPLLVLLAERANPPSTLTVLVQREVAERVLASPGTSAWGSLAISLQSAYSGRVLRELSPGLFRPRPKVQSALVKLERLQSPWDPQERRRVLHLARLLFLHRRQSLGRALARFHAGDIVTDALAGCALPANARAEQLDLTAFRRLVAVLPEPAVREIPGMEG